MYNSRPVLYRSPGRSVQPAAICTTRLETGRRSVRGGAFSLSSSRSQAKSWETGPRPADEQSCGLSLDLYKSPDPQADLYNSRPVARTFCTTHFILYKSPERSVQLASRRGGDLLAWERSSRLSCSRGQAKSSEAGPRPADEQSCGLSLDLYKSPDPQNRCLPCRRCLPRSLRQTTPTRQTDLSSDRSYELRAHLSPPFPGADLYNSRPVLYNSLRGREAICTTHSERCVVFVAEELFCLNHRHFEADSFGYRRSPPTRFLLPSQGAGKEY